MDKTRKKNGIKLFACIAVLIMLLSVLPTGALAKSVNAEENGNGMSVGNSVSTASTDDDSDDDADDADDDNNDVDDADDDSNGEDSNDDDADDSTDSSSAKKMKNVRMNAAAVAGSYQDAKLNFANIRSKNPELDTEEAIEATKDYLNSTIDYILTFLDEEDTDYIEMLEAERENVETAETRKELAESAKNIREILNDARKDRIASKGRYIDNKVTAIIKTSNAMAVRLENEINRMEENGHDVTELEEMLDEYNELLTSAEENQENARNEYRNGQGGPAENIREANQYFTEAGNDIKEANKVLRNMFGMIKQQREGIVTLSGTGTLEAEGDGTVVISGDVTIDLSIEDGRIIVKDLADDVNITMDDDAYYDRSNIDTGNSTDNNRAFVFTNITGDVFIKGSRLTVMIKGTDIVLEAEGTGTAVLSGEGSYDVDGTEGEKGEWAKRTDDTDDDAEDETEVEAEDEQEPEPEDEQEDGDSDDDSADGEDENGDSDESGDDEEDGDNSDDDGSEDDSDDQDDTVNDREQDETETE